MAKGRASGTFPDRLALEKKLLFSEETIHDRVKTLGEEIASDYADKEPVCIGVLNGVVFFFADLMRAIRIPIRMDFIRAASYGSRTTSSGVVRITKPVEVPVRGRHVIVVEDIVDTGLTLQYILNKIREENPDSLRICALIDKAERRRTEISIDYCGFKVESGFIVGYGLDYDEKYRNLPGIYILK